MKTGETLGPIETHIVVTKGIDKNGHLNNVWWGLGLQQGRLEAAAALGVNLNASLRRLCINYDAQIFLGDHIVVVTSITDRENSVIFNQNIQRENTAIGSSFGVFGHTTVELDEPLSYPLSRLAVRLGKVFPAEGPMLHHLTAPYYFEKGRERFLSAKGLDMRELREGKGIRFVVAILNIRYFQPMYAGQHVEIRSALEVDDSLFIFQQQVTEGDKVISVGDITCVIIDQDNCLVDNPKIINPIARQLLISKHTF